jgi:hypothetical protein
VMMARTCRQRPGSDINRSRTGFERSVSARGRAKNPRSSVAPGQTMSRSRRRRDVLRGALNILARQILIESATLRWSR